MSCGSITRGSDVEDCNDLPEGGTEARLILFNWDDILLILESNGEGGTSGNVWGPEFDDTFGPVVTVATGTGVITQIILYPGKKGYEFIGFRNDVKKSDEVVKHANLKNRFRHACSFVVYEVDQVQKNNLRDLVKGRFLAIVENKGKDENSLEVLGKTCGLSIVGGLIRDASSGVFIISLATPDNGIEFERKLPQNFGDSYATGLEMIGVLLEEPEALTVDATDITVDSDLVTSDQTMR